MSNNNEIVKTIDKDLGGKPLKKETIDSFELAVNKFIEEYGNNKTESKRKIKEIEDFLSNTEDNLKTIKDQNGFQKVWQTLNGKNKKLEIANKENMLEAQKGSLFFLQKLSDHNQFLGQTVLKALKRIERIQFENEKLRNSITVFAVRVNKRIKEHESILKRINNFAVALTAAILLLGISIVLFYFYRSSKIILFAGIFAIAFSMASFLLAFTKNKRNQEKNDDEFFDKFYIDNKQLLNLKQNRNDNPIVFNNNDAKVLLSIVSSMLDSNLLTSSFLRENFGKFTITRSEKNFRLKAKGTIIYSYEDMNNLRDFLTIIFLKSATEITTRNKEIIIVARGDDLNYARILSKAIASLYNVKCNILGPDEYEDNINELFERPLISLGGPMYNTLTKSLDKSCKYLHNNGGQHIGYIKTRKKWILYGDFNSDSVVDIYLNKYIKDIIRYTK